nr:hypothetical protein [Tanacetum cinerariifolium]
MVLNKHAIILMTSYQSGWKQKRQCRNLEQDVSQLLSMSCILFEVSILRVHFTVEVPTGLITSHREWSMLVQYHIHVNVSVGTTATGYGGLAGAGNDGVGLAGEGDGVADVAGLGNGGAHDGVGVVVAVVFNSSV